MKCSDCAPPVALALALFYTMKIFILGQVLYNGNTCDLLPSVTRVIDGSKPHVLPLLPNVRLCATSDKRFKSDDVTASVADMSLMHSNVKV